MSSKILQTVILSNVFGYVSPMSGRVRSGVDAREQAAPPLSAYTSISRRNIFNSGSGEDDALEALKAKKIEEPMEASGLNVLLLGTTVGPPEDTFAVIEDLETREQDLYQVGDTVQEEARIVKVSRCQVVL